jgi:hypothetical protein
MHAEKEATFLAGCTVLGPEDGSAAKTLIFNDWRRRKDSK